MADQDNSSVNRNPSGELWGHPKGLFLLFLVEMWERFSYYGMRALLVLYLIAVPALHQIPEGAYSNTLEFCEVQPAAEGEPTDANRELVRSVNVDLLVGNVPNPPAHESRVKIRESKTVEGKTAVSETSANAQTAPALKIERLKRVPDPKEPTKTIWVPDSAADTDHVVVRTEKDKKQNDETEFAFRVSNPTDQTIKLNVGMRREDDGNSRTYFTVNDSSGYSTLDIRPSKEQTADDKPYDIIIAPNLHDSGRNWKKPDATNCQGWYAGLCYLTPLIGGLIADKLIGTHRSMVVGGLLIALGHVALGVSGFGDMNQSQFGMDVFVMGLALIVIGTGHFKPSVSVMVGQLYSLNDPRRESAFSIFYMGINLGAFLCNYVCGTLGQLVGWHWGFGAAAVGMLAGLGLYVTLREKYLHGIGDPPSRAGKSAPMFLIIGVALAALIGYAYHEGFLQKFDQIISQQSVAIGLACAAIAWAIYYTINQQPEDRGPVFTIFLVTIFNAVFWLAFEQASTSINVFTEERTDRHILGTELPATWFQSVNPMLIFIGAPLFGVLWTYLAKRKANPSQGMKIFFGLVFLSLGYGFMTYAGHQAAAEGTRAAMWLILATYFWHTVGELCLSPTGLSYVTRTAPKSGVSMLMGVYLMSSFIANLIGGKLAGYVEPIEQGKIRLPWDFGGQANFFFLFVVVSLAAAILVLILNPVLKRLARPET